MRGSRLSTGFKATLTLRIVSLAAMFVTGTFSSAQERVLFSFDHRNGASPFSGLTSDSYGNFYGTTYSGGNYGDGTVFKVTPEATGSVLHSFNAPDADGRSPIGGVTFDASGNLFGTTSEGGLYRLGSVFELTPATSGWSEKLLHTFINNGEDGTTPVSGLIFDAAGHVFGTTLGGGTLNIGTVFELTQGANGTWTEKVIHSFNNTDGHSPFAGLILDPSGNLYGTTFYGGAYGYGVVFELTRNGGEEWSERVLHSFSNTDGANPAASLIFDAAGNLYGVTTYGGAYGRGTAFELVRSASGNWRGKILYNFNSNGTDGQYPGRALVFDAIGNLYGTTQYGGAFGQGTAFKLMPGPHDRWTEHILHDFGSAAGDGEQPVSTLVFGAHGHLYGTTFYGGSHKSGTVFEITP
jgi:uncharacterized repeat protein (TIGR03803 family)